MMGKNSALGIDIGGTGVKAAQVDLTNGRFTSQRLRVRTPQPSTPAKVLQVVFQLIGDLGWFGVIGCTFPGVVRAGVTQSAANVHKSWVGFSAQAALEARLEQPVALINDADAAGLAELQYGAARNQHGTVLVLTLGTGLGSALFCDGKLVPNTELGHLTLHGDSAENYMTDRARRRDQLSWVEWAARINEYLAMVDRLFSPDQYILGGGVSRKHEHFLPLLRANAPILPAKLRNRAGIVGAALHGMHQWRNS